MLPVPRHAADPRPGVFATHAPPLRDSYCGPASKFVLHGMCRSGVALTPIQAGLREWDCPHRRRDTAQLILHALEFRMQDAWRMGSEASSLQALMWALATPRTTEAEVQDPRFLDMFMRFVAQPTQDRLRATAVTQAFDSAAARDAWVHTHTQAALERLRAMERERPREWAMLCIRVLQEELDGVFVEV